MKKLDLTKDTITSLIIKAALGVSVPSVIIFTANFFFFRFPAVEASYQKCEHDGRITKRIVCKMAIVTFKDKKEIDEIVRACTDE